MSLRSATRPMVRGTFFTAQLPHLQPQALRPTPIASQCLLQAKQRQMHTCHSSSALFSIAPARHAPRFLPTKSLSLTSKRNETTTTQPTPTPSSTSSTTASTPTISLTWNDFFRLRQRRRYLDRGSSFITAFTALSGGLGTVAAQDLDSLQFFGLDPLIASFIICMSCGAAGWLAGPLLGTVLFRIFVGRSREMAAKERDFYARIKKYRIDPSSSSMQNPVPDFYGEKITSVAGYRQWLKDQRAFNRKRESFL